MGNVSLSEPQAITGLAETLYLLLPGAGAADQLA